MAVASGVRVSLATCEDRRGAFAAVAAISPFIRAGTVSTVKYNHYSLLRTNEDIFGLGHLGDAAAPGADSVGNDVFDDLPDGPSATVLLRASGGSRATRRRR